MKFIPVSMISTRIGKKGQVVIPKEIREKLGVKPGDIIVFKMEGERIFLEAIGEKLKDILKAGKPVEQAIEFQRRLRDEWNESMY